MLKVTYRARFAGRVIGSDVVIEALGVLPVHNDVSVMRFVLQGGITTYCHGSFDRGKRETEWVLSLC